MSHSSVVGGSTAPRVLACPGSIDLCRKLPPEPASVYAQAGTDCHSEMETWLLQEAGEHVFVDKHTLQAKIKPAREWFTDNFADVCDFWVEREVNFGADIVDPVTGEKAFGTADVIFRHDDGQAGVIDWKFGDGHLVSAADNDQMRFYLSAAIRSGYLPRQPVYQAWIFQPSMKLSPDDYASMGEYTHDDLEHFTARLRAAVVTLPRPFATGKHCHWCRAKTVCDAYLDSQFGDARQILNLRSYQNI